MNNDISKEELKRRIEKSLQEVEDGITLSHWCVKNLPRWLIRFLFTLKRLRAVIRKKLKAVIKKN